MEVAVDRIKMILKSSLTRNIGLVSAALLASGYTVQRVHPDLPQMSAVDAILARDVLGTTPPGWDLPNIDNPRVDSWVTVFSTNPKVKSVFATWLDRKPTYEPMISAKL